MVGPKVPTAAGPWVDVPPREINKTDKVQTDTKTDAKIKVFLVDDHAIVRRGLEELINDEDDMIVVGEAGRAADAANRVEATSPDVVILDYQLPDGNGVEVCREIRDRFPTVACLMLTAFSDDNALVFGNHGWRTWLHFETGSGQ